MSRLSPLDLAFFLTEHPTNPKHVAGLLRFTRPKGAKRDFAEQLYKEFLANDDVQPPFDQVVDFLAFGGPRWRTAMHIDMEQHIFYHCPDKRLNDKQLHQFAAKELHEPLMDRHRPMWEFHIIDNVGKNGFAIYSKVHHAYADGMSMARWTLKMMSESPKTKDITPIWAYRKKRKKTDTREQLSLFRSVLKGAGLWWDIYRGIAKLVAQMVLEQVGLTKNAVALPFRGTDNTPLVGEITSDRQFITAQVPMARISRIRKTTRSSLNHVALTCIDGALRHYLHDHDIKLEKPLTIHMPVNLRDGSEQDSGNKLGIVLVELAPETVDPYQRLREIGFTLRNVRNQIDGVPAISVSYYTAIMAVVIETLQLFKLNRYLPPIADTLVSNVPGPEKPLYLAGAKMESIVPISTLTPGNRLNITLFSYVDKLHFGLVGTDALGDISTLAHYIEKAFEELEDAVCIVPMDEAPTVRKAS